MKLIPNLFINFCVGFISDIILNDLSKIKKFKYFNSLYPYFKNKSIIIAAIYAGITTSICIYIAILINKYLNINYFLLVFIVGYFIDIFIEKYKIFSNLEDYYETIGSGIYGGVAILFSSIISYIIYYYLLPIIYDC